jgi:hypothetical protein
MCLLCKSIKYDECVYIFALIIQHADCMFSALYYMACVDLHFFPHYKEHNFWKKIIERKMYVLILSTTYVSNISS